MEKWVMIFILAVVILMNGVFAQIPTLKLNETTNGTGSTKSSIFPIIELKNPANISLSNVNRSIFWGNYYYGDYDMPTILSYATNQTLGALTNAQKLFLNLSGTNANQNIKIGKYNFTATSFNATASTGRQPYECRSTTLNTNLNADLWDGNQFATYLNQPLLTTSDVTFNTIHSLGDITTSGDYILARTNPSVNNTYIRLTTISPLAGNYTIIFPAQSGNVFIIGGTDLSVNDGGTGVSSWVTNGIIYASGTTTLAQSTGLTYNGNNLNVSKNISGDILKTTNQVCNNTACFTLDELNTTGTGSGMNYTNIFMLNQSNRIWNYTTYADNITILTGKLHIGVTPTAYENYEFVVNTTNGGIVLFRNSLTNEPFIQISNNNDAFGGQFRGISGGIKLIDSGLRTLLFLTSPATGGANFSVQIYSNRSITAREDMSAGNFTANNKLGLTGNYSLGSCWQYFTGGILTSTNCTLI